MKCHIDEVAIYDRSLNIAEIYSLADTSVRGGNETHLVAVTKYKKGFINRLFFRKTIQIFVDCDEIVEMPVAIGSVSLFKVKPFKAYSLNLWHKNGVVDNTLSNQVGKVYKNGKLANTKGKYEMITVVMDKKADTKPYTA